MCLLGFGLSLVFWFCILCFLEFLEGVVCYSALGWACGLFWFGYGCPDLSLGGCII